LLYINYDYPARGLGSATPQKIKEGRLLKRRTISAGKKGRMINTKRHGRRSIPEVVIIELIRVPIKQVF